MNCFQMIFCYKIGSKSLSFSIITIRSAPRNFWEVLDRFCLTQFSSSRSLASQSLSCPQIEGDKVMKRRGIDGLHNEDSTGKGGRGEGEGGEPQCLTPSVLIPPESETHCNNHRLASREEERTGNETMKRPKTSKYMWIIRINFHFQLFCSSNSPSPLDSIYNWVRLLIGNHIRV